MDLLKFDEVKQTWLQIAQHEKGLLPPSSLELEVYKKLLSRFHVGAYYYYIFNVAAIDIEFVSREIVSVMGYTPENFSVETVIGNIHPEDKDRFIAYEQKVTDFFSKLSPQDVLKYKVSYDYRLRCADGSYKWILQQVSTIQSNENGAVIRVLGVHTDITHFKTDNKPAGLSFIGLDNNPSYHNALLPDGNQQLPPLLFTNREKDIFKLVLAGKNTEEISSLLSISHHTVSVHRKNILKKSSCKSFLELISLVNTQAVEIL